MWLDLQELTAWAFPAFLPAIAPPVAPRLSDAMRRGLEICPNDLHGQWIDLPESAACAVGTIFIGAGLDENRDSIIGGLKRVYPEFATEIKCPASGADYTLSLGLIINNLYEYHGWSRQRILDWLVVEGY